nr:RNA polymerase sigma factor SigE [Nocardioides houyundeii]
MSADSTANESSGLREHRGGPDRSRLERTSRLAHSLLSVPLDSVGPPPGARHVGEHVFGAPFRTHQEAPVTDSTQQTSEVPTWDEVVTRHSDRVFRLAYRLTGNRHDAEDLTQEVFVRVFRSLDSYTPGTFEGWLHRITTNLFLDSARRRQRIRFDALSDERASRLTSSEATPDAAYADQTFDDDVERALATLPPDFRAAVVLCDVEGLSYEEIAEILDAKLGTVRSRIHRGRGMLRTALAHRAPSDGRERYAGPTSEALPALGGHQ